MEFIVIEKNQTCIKTYGSFLQKLVELVAFLIESCRTHFAAFVRQINAKQSSFPARIAVSFDRVFLRNANANAPPEMKKLFYYKLTV